MQIKKKTLYTLNGIFSQLKQMKAKPKFQYGVIKNLKILSSEMEVLEEVRKSLQVKGWEAYTKKQDELVLKYSEKDEEGKPIRVGQTAVKLVEETKDEFFEKKKELEEEFKDLIEEYTKNNSEFEKILDEDLEIELLEMDIDSFPESLQEDGSLMELFIDTGILK